VNKKYLSHHYGAWYLKPKNFNDSMMAHKLRITKDEMMKMERNEEMQEL
jgi:hypothetical protein